MMFKEKSFTHYTINVMICNEKLLLSYPTKTDMKKKGFFQT